MEVATSINQQLINEIDKHTKPLNETVKSCLREYKNYLELMKDEKYIEKEDEKEEDAIKRAESIFDRLDEIIKRNEFANKKAKETIEILNEMAELLNEIVKKTEDEKEELEIRNNEIIDIIIDLERRKTSKLIEQNPRQKHELKGKFKDKKEELNEQKSKVIKPKNQLTSVAKAKGTSIQKLNECEMKEKDDCRVQFGNNSTQQKETKDENHFFFYITKYEGPHWDNGKTTYIFLGEFFKFSVSIHYNINEKDWIEEFTNPRAEIKEGINSQDPIIHIQILFAGYFETHKKAETFINGSKGSSVENKQISKSKRYYLTQDYYYKNEFGMIPLIIPIPRECEYNKKGYLLFYNHLKNKTANDFLLLEMIE